MMNETHDVTISFQNSSAFADHARRQALGELHDYFIEYSFIEYSMEPLAAGEKVNEWKSLVELELLDPAIFFYRAAAASGFSEELDWEKDDYYLPSVLFDFGLAQMPELLVDERAKFDEFFAQGKELEAQQYSLKLN